MEVDLYQRHGLYGLGADDVPVTDQPIPAYLQAPSAAINALNTPGIFGGMSWSTIALLGIGTWFVLSMIGRGTSKAYKTVAAPIKKRRKKKRALGEARERYERERRRIESGESSRRGGGFF